MTIRYTYPNGPSDLWEDKKNRKHVSPRELALSHRQSSDSLRPPSITEHPINNVNDLNQNYPIRMNLDKPVPNSFTTTHNPKVPRPLATTTSDEFQAFAHTLPFTLTFHTIAYPLWSTHPEQALRYLPVPLQQLPHIPAIPSQLEISFTQIMDTACFIDTINGILSNNGYADISQLAAWKVYVSYTHRGGKRTRIAVNVDHVELLTRPWAKDVWLGHADAIASCCDCERCRGETSDGGEGVKVYGHGLEVEVVFPQGTEKRYRPGPGGVARAVRDEMFGGRVKKPFQPVGSAAARNDDECAGVTRKVRFQRVNNFHF